MIRFVFRWLFRLVILALVLATALFLLKDTLLREWLVYRVRHVTGLETRLAGLKTEWFAGTLTLTGLQLYNTAEFGGGPFLDAPDLHVEIDTAALRQRELKLRLARVHIAEFSLVRNLQGQTNLYSMMDHANARASVVDAVAVAPPGLEFRGIDTLNLTLGTLRLVQLSPPPVNREIRLGVTNEIIRNVRSTADFTPLIMQIVVRELSNSFSPPVANPNPNPNPRR